MHSFDYHVLYIADILGSFFFFSIFHEIIFGCCMLQQIPLSHISEAVYKTSADWINQRSIVALGSFVLWSLDSILADLASQQGGSKGSKKGAQQASSKSQVSCWKHCCVFFTCLHIGLMHGTVELWFFLICMNV
jgi:hypothetical protein